MKVQGLELHKKYESLTNSYNSLKLILSPNLVDDKNFFINSFLDIISSQLRIFIQLVSLKEANKLFELLNQNNENLSKNITILYDSLIKNETNSLFGDSLSDSIETTGNCLFEKGFESHRKLKTFEIDYLEEPKPELFNLKNLKVSTPFKNVKEQKKEKFENRVKENEKFESKEKRKTKEKDDKKKLKILNKEKKKTKITILDKNKRLGNFRINQKKNDNNRSSRFLNKETKLNKNPLSLKILTENKSERVKNLKIESKMEKDYIIEKYKEENEKTLGDIRIIKSENNFHQFPSYPFYKMICENGIIRNIQPKELFIPIIQTNSFISEKKVIKKNSDVINIKKNLNHSKTFSLNNLLVTCCTKYNKHLFLTKSGNIIIDQYQKNMLENYVNSHRDRDRENERIINMTEGRRDCKTRPIISKENTISSNEKNKTQKEKEKDVEKLLKFLPLPLTIYIKSYINKKNDIISKIEKIAESNLMGLEF